jgi:hypothetical protein
MHQDSGITRNGGVFGPVFSDMNGFQGSQMDAGWIDKLCFFENLKLSALQYFNKI